MSGLSESAQTVTASVSGSILVALIFAFAAWLRSMHRGLLRVIRALEGQEETRMDPAVPGLVADVREARAELGRIDKGQAAMIQRMDATERDLAALATKVADHADAVQTLTREQQILGGVVQVLRPPRPVDPPDPA